MAQDQTITNVARSLGRDYSANLERRQTSAAQFAPAVTNRNNDEHVNPRDSHANGLATFSFARLILFTTAMLAFLSLGILLLAHYLGNEIAQGGHTLNRKPIEVVIGNNVLDIPANMIRFSSERRSGDHEQLELYAYWPSLEGYTEENSRFFNNIDDTSDIIFLTLGQREMAMDMSGRIDTIYNPSFVGPKEDVGMGLVRQLLSSEAGYIDEYLYYEKDSPYPFAARCIKPGSSVGEPICIRDVHVGKNLTLTYRFHIKHLNDWLRLDERIRSLIQTMIVSN